MTDEAKDSGSSPVDQNEILDGEGKSPEELSNEGTPELKDDAGTPAASVVPEEAGAEAGNEDEEGDEEDSEEGDEE